MPRWEEYLTSAANLEAGQRARSRSDNSQHHHFSLLQGGQRSSHLNQRGFISPRSIMLSDDYDTLDSTTSTPRGYLPPGTHSIPHTQDPNSRSMSTSISGGGGPPNCTYGRRPTPRPSSHSNRSSPGFGARLGYAQNHSGLPANPYRQQDTPRYYPNPGHLGPIFPEEEDDTFFPPDTLPPIDEAFGEYRGKGGEEESVDFLGNPIGYPQLSDEHSRAKFEERLATFPEVPLEAHRRIFLMGNEIVDSYEVRLDRFYRGSLLDSILDCTAVFTKKERTGQRWLMVFKEDITRTVVKFNRLLTHSLLVRVVSPTGIEIEAAKNLYGPPAEMCVINFDCIEDASRFYKMLQEGQTTAWNHREVTHEQRMKTVFTKINQALAAADLEMMSGISSGPGSGSSSVRRVSLSRSPSRELPQSRSPFTFSLRNRGERVSMSQSQSPASKAPVSGLRLRTVSRSPAPCSSGDAYLHIADLDDDWRHDLSRRGSDRLNVVEGRAMSESGSMSERDRQRSSSQSQHHRFLKKSLNLNNSGQMSNLSLDGSGDGYNSNAKVSALMMGLKLKQQSPPSPPASDEPLIPVDVIFQVKVTVFVKLDPGDSYAEFGTGTLQLLDHHDVALDELRLLDGDKREILQQYIYKWNSALRKSSDDEMKKGPVCIWDGAVCFSLEPDAVPERRDFKARLSSEEEADGFVDAFMKSVEKARDESIRKRHINWYLHNKRDYKKISTNALTPESEQF